MDESRKENYTTPTLHSLLLWIDTSVMLADCLTKKMRSPPLIKFMQDGDIDLTPTLDSLWIKAKKQAARAKGKPSKTEGEQVGKGRPESGVPGAVDEQAENDYNGESAHLSLIFDGLT